MSARSEAEEAARLALVDAYTRALGEYLDGGGEDALIRAYDLSRKAIGSGIGVVDMALIHQAATLRTRSAVSASEHERIGQFLAETLSPFELTHRGFREANQRLSQLIEELRKKNEQLERTARELMQANQATREANLELEAFSHTVAHDLRTPLNAVIGFAELLEEERDQSKARAYAGEIAGAARQMNTLISVLLSFARNARGEMNKAYVDLSDMAARIVENLRSTMTYANAEVRIAAGLRCYADPGLIEVVLTNLLSNALKYSSKEAAPEVEVDLLAINDGVATFFVRDNGAGFDMAHANKLFAAFQRLHSAEAFEGNGVGLATVQRIIHRHGGDVWAQGAIGRGATFYFTLEVTPEAFEVAARV